MKFWHILLFLSLFLENALMPHKAIAQETTTEEEIPPDFGTVPGIYYDPDAGESPSLSEMEGTESPGSIETEYHNPNCNHDRVWAEGATADTMIKVCDLENDPALENVVEIEKLTLREIAANGGADIESASVKDIGLINSMTVGEFLEMFPQYKDRSVFENPILRESIDKIDEVLAEEGVTTDEGFLQIERNRLIIRLSRVEELEGVPLAQIINGEYEEAVDEATREILEEVVERYPELADYSVEEASPIISDLINSGDWEETEERVLEKGEQELVERLANDSRFENIPVEALAEGNWGEVLEEAEQRALQVILRRYPELAQVPIDKAFPMVNGIINGDWSSIVKEAQEYAYREGNEVLTRELINAYPQLADAPLGALPIDDILVGDIEGLADAALDRVPNIANRYVAELGNLSQTPGTMLAVDTALILTTGDVFGRLDIPFAGDVETPITYVLSGGTRNQVFLPEPCIEIDCKHFEVVDVLTGFAGTLNGLGVVQGKAWVQGSSQDVPGGKGMLRWVNNGKERTGVPVWTTDSHVKISLEDIDEGGEGEESTARIWLNFQVCIYPPFMGEHCTPHVFSFATPWKVKSGGIMVVFSRTSPSDLIEYGRERARDEGDRGTDDEINRTETNTTVE
jgi:hypothetical protein